MTAAQLRSGAASLLTLLVAGALLAAVPAAAPAVEATTPGVTRSVRPGHLTVHKGKDHFPATTKFELPPNFDATVSSPTLPPNATSIKVTVSAEDAAEAEQFRQFAVFLTRLRKPGDRLLMCLAMHQVQLSTWNGSTAKVEIVEDRAEAALIYLAGCLRVARLIAEIEAGQRAAQPGLSRAVAKCAQGARELPAKVTKIATGYRLTISGTPKKARKGGGLKVACKGSGASMTFTVQARKKGKSLRSVVGDQLSFSVLSPPDATTSVSTSVTFAKPR
jgi:hypothetical protein